MTRGISEATYAAYLEALLAGDRAACARIVAGLTADAVDLKLLYVDLFQRALYDVGEQWAQQQISVAVEHLATAITERLIADVQPTLFSGAPHGRSAVIACVADEYHQLGARMIADFCEMRGWRGHFLGANTPVADLMHLLATRQPTILGLSLSMYANLPRLLDAVAAVEHAHPELPILVGGQALRWGNVSGLDRFRNVSLIASLDQLESTLGAYEEH